MGKTNLGSAVYRVQADTTEYQKSFKKAGAVTDKFKGQSGAMVSAVAAIDGPLGGIGSRVRSLNSLLTRSNILFASLAVGISGASFAAIRSIREFSRFEQAQFRTQALLRITGNVSGLTANQLETMAQKIALATLASADGVRAAQASLLSFTSIGGDNFERTLNISQSIAAVFGGDIKSNVEKVGRALENPIKRIAGLERTVGALDEKQIDLAKSAFEAGDALKAQNIILGELEKKLGNVGAEEGAGIAGKVDALALSFENLFITLSKDTGLASVFGTMVDALGVPIRALDSAIKPDTLEENIEKREELLKRLASFRSLGGIGDSSLSKDALKAQLADLNKIIEAQEALVQKEEAAQAQAKESQRLNQIALAEKRKELELEEELKKEKTALRRAVDRIVSQSGSNLDKENRRFKQNLADLKRANELSKKDQFESTEDFNALIEEETRRHTAAVNKILLDQEDGSALFDIARADSAKNLEKITRLMQTSYERRLDDINKYIGEMQAAMAFDNSNAAQNNETMARLVAERDKILAKVSSPTTLYDVALADSRANIASIQQELRSSDENDLIRVRQYINEVQVARAQGLEDYADYNSLLTQLRDQESEILSKLRNPTTLFDTAKDDSKNFIKQLSDSLLTSNERELQQVQEQSSKLEAAYALRVVSKEKYQKLSAALDTRQTGIQQEIDAPTDIFLEDFEKIRNNFLTTEEEEKAHFARRMEVLKQYEAERPTQQAAINDAMEQERAQHQQRMTAIDLKEEQTRRTALGLFGSAAQTLMNAENRKLFELGKAAAISTAIVNTALGVTEALKLGPIIGPPLAAMQAAAGIVQIQQINATKFKGGGSTASVPSTPNITSNITPPSIPLAEQTSGRDVQINFNGDFNGLTPDFIDQLADGIKERIEEADYVLIESSSRQAQELAA